MTNFTNNGYIDIHFMYGVVNRHSSKDRKIYRKHFSSRELQNMKTFRNIHMRLRETETF